MFIFVILCVLQCIILERYISLFYDVALKRYKGIT